MNKQDFEILMNSLYSNNQLFIPQGQNIKDWIDNAFVDTQEQAINYSRCSTPLKRESKSFFNIKNLADLKRLYPNKESYSAKVCDGYIKYYVDGQLVITTALMV